MLLASRDEARDNLPVRRFHIKRIANAQAECTSDTVAVEEPLEIRITHWFKDARISENLALTMRTPGDDRELTAGLLLSEGIIRTREHLADLRPLGGGRSNEMMAELSRGVDVQTWKLARSAFVNSSCGICGKRSRDAVAQAVPDSAQDKFEIKPDLITNLPDLLRKQQAGFAQTGGLHAAALANTAGEIEAAFEDIGRHNALDKLIGWALLGNRIPLRSRVLFMSSRSSFELIQKAAMAGAPVLATVGGPSSLAIEAARDYGITLIGFVREGHFNVYSGEWRIIS